MGDPKGGVHARVRHPAHSGVISHG
jgi:hypothetical protein